MWKLSIAGVRRKEKSAVVGNAYNRLELLRGYMISQSVWLRRHGGKVSTGWLTKLSGKTV